MEKVSGIVGSDGSGQRRDRDGGPDYGHSGLGVNGDPGDRTTTLRAQGVRQRTRDRQDQELAGENRQKIMAACDDCLPHNPPLLGMI
jgi:hypothetical protein